MDLIELLKKRYSVRQFSDVKVEKEKIDKIFLCRQVTNLY